MTIRDGSRSIGSDMDWRSLPYRGSGPINALAFSLGT